MKTLQRFLSYLQDHRSQLVKFTVFGFLTFGINLFCFHIFYGMLKLNYQFSISFAYIITVASHFSLHRTFTFRASKEKAIPHIWRYVAMLVTNYLVTLFVMWLTVNIAKLSPYFGLFFSTGFSAGMSFFVMKYLVFKK